jgi:hypothetical protein
MSSHLTISQKIEKLRSIGWHIEECEGGYIAGGSNANNPYFGGGFLPLEIKTARDISRYYKHEFESIKKWKKTVKELTNGVDRAAQRDLIKTENFDDIPEGQRVKVENPWRWD